MATEDRHFTHSTLRERIVEHVFVGDVLRTLWRLGVTDVEILRPFHTWTVETGPVLDEVSEVCDKIAADLAKNEVPTAAGRLRRHLEFLSAELVDELGAKANFRVDGGYDMEELLSAVIGRQGELLKSALKAAKSWDDKEQIAKVEALKKTRNEILTASNGEQWVINKAIHYNEWADLSKNDFKPVVTEFNNFFSCSGATSQSAIPGCL